MVDVVIPLGTGSKTGDLELRYALRLLEKNVSNVGDVYVIGKRPKGFTNLIVHEIPEFAGGQYRHHNICNKVLFACELPELTDNFLFMNDDHFINQWFDAADFPNFYDDYLYKKGVKLNIVSPYRKTITNTFEHLKSFGLNSLNFDVHCPILFNKNNFKNLFAELKQPEYGYCIKSIYGNYFRVDPRKIDDEKVNEPLSAAALSDLLKGRPWFSCGDKGFTKAFIKALESAVPNKSKYEL